MDYSKRFIYFQREIYNTWREKYNGNRTEWGDLNPSTKKMEGDYGSKHKGAVKPSESLITEENGFDNIVTLEPGYSPIDYIEQLEKNN